MHWIHIMILVHPENNARGASPLKYSDDMRSDYPWSFHRVLSIVNFVDVDENIHVGIYE